MLVTITPKGFEAFIDVALSHSRLIPLIEIIQEDPPEWERLKLYWYDRGTSQMISDLYDLLEILEEDEDPIASMSCLLYTSPSPRD